MRRDMDFVREMLARIAEHPTDDADVPLDFPGRTDAVIHYHLHIMVQAGLIEALDGSDNEGLHYLPERLTWKGNDFLDLSRDPTIWKRAMERTKSAAGAVSLDILTDLLKHFARDALGLPPG